jgi:hypothetical protein
MATERKAPTVYATPGALSTEPGPRTDERYAYVKSLGAMFRWELGASDTTDDLNFIGHSGGSPGRWHRIVTTDRGANLTNASVSIDVSGNRWRVLPASTLTANRTCTVEPDAAQEGDVIVISREDAEAYTYSIVNGGPSAGTLATLGSSGGFVELYFDGEDWEVKRSSSRGGSVDGVSVAGPILNSGTGVAPIIDISDATTSVRGAMSATDKTRADRLNGNLLTDRANLTDADATIAISGGKWRHLPASTLSTDRTVTLSSTGAALGDTITISRSDYSQRHLTVVDGVGSTKLHRLSAAGATAEFFFDGTNWKYRKSTHASGSQRINVVELGADPTGVADSAAAFQAAFDACEVRSAEIFVPRGNYNIGSTITFEPSALARHYRIVGEGPTDYNQVDGPRLVWTGSVGGTMFTQVGANRCYMVNLTFDCAKRAKFGIVATYGHAGSIGSSSCVFEDLRILAPTGSGSACVKLGDTVFATRQVSEYTFQNCDLQAADDGTSSYGFYQAQGGNTKNFSFWRCTVGGGFDQDFYFPEASGHYTLLACNTSGTVVSSLHFEGGGNIYVCGHGWEAFAGARFLYGRNAFINIESSELYGDNGTSGMVDFIGHLDATNSSFKNTIAGDVEIHIGDGAGAGTDANNGQSYTFDGCIFEPCAADGPYRVCSAEYKYIGDNTNWHKGLAIPFREFGCAYDDDADGSRTIRAPIDFTVPSYMTEDIFQHQVINPAATAAVVQFATPRRVLHKVRFTYQDLIVASPAKTFSVANIPAKTIVHGIWADVTQAFAGVTGPLTGRVTVGGANWLSTFSISSLAQFGLSSGDLGAGVTAAVQYGGHMTPWAAEEELTLVLAAGDNWGNGTITSANAGAITLYIITERIA